MLMTALVTTGIVAFCNLSEHEEYKGKTTGRYSIVVTMDESEAQKLHDLGVKVREYDGKPQRKFSSKYDVVVVDMQNEPTTKDIPYGSEVRLLWSDGPAHSEHGTPTYLNRVRVVSLAETSGGETPDEF